MTMRTNVFLSLAFATVGTGALAGCGENSVPETITYEHDVKPVLDAHCVRCHGAGGTLNTDPDIDPTFVQNFGPKPTMAYFDTLAHAQASRLLIPAFINNPMPPPPAPLLTDYERQILLQWKGD